LGDDPWWEYGSNGASVQRTTMQHVRYQGDGYFRNRIGLSFNHTFAYEGYLEDLRYDKSLLNKGLISEDQFTEKYKEGADQNDVDKINHTFGIDLVVLDDGRLGFYEKGKNEWARVDGMNVLINNANFVEIGEDQTNGVSVQTAGMGFDLQSMVDQFESVKEDISTGAEFVWDAAGGTRDFIRTYIQMREANHVNSDKYFHAKANFLAASRGDGGIWIAEKLSNLREAFDMRWPKYDSYQQSMADQQANMYGRSQTQFYNRRQFVDALRLYRPATLPVGY